MDKHIEDLSSKSRIERLKRKFELAKLYGSDQLTVPMPDLDALLAKLEAAEKEISEWRSIAEAAAQDDADWHKLTDSKNEVISQLAQGIIQLKESAEQNAKALNRVAHHRNPRPSRKKNHRPTP